MDLKRELWQLKQMAQAEPMAWFRCGKGHIWLLGMADGLRGLIAHLEATSSKTEQG
jgi:hypothetical protein